MSKSFFLIPLIVLFPQIALAMSEAPESNWIELLLNRIPSETIMWMVAFFGLLNGVSEGLAKLDEAITKYSEKTETEADDKIAAVLHVIASGLKKFVGYLKVLIDFFTAKPKSR